MNAALFPEPRADQRRNAVRAVVLFFLSNLTSLGLLIFQSTREPSAQLRLVVIMVAVVNLFEILALAAVWRGRSELGVWLATLPTLLSLIGLVTLVSGVAFIFAAAGIVLVLFAGPLTLPPRQGNMLILASVVIAVAVLLVDVAVANTERIVVAGFDQFIYYALAALLAILGYSLFRQSRAYLQTYRSSIRNQFSTLMTLLTVVAVILLSVTTIAFAVQRTGNALQAGALAQLESVRTIKLEQLNAFFTERSGNVKLNSNTTAMREALAAFSNGFAQSSPERIRSLYLGKVDQTDAGDGGDFTEAHREYSPYLSSIAQTFGFYDVFVIARNGQVVYTYAKEDDFGTNLAGGQYADTNLAEAYRAALELPQGEVAVTDFAFYAPSADAPAAFMAAPIYDSGRVVGVLAVQLPLDKISAIMQERTGLGETGETFVVGEDRLFRSESLFAPDTLLKVEVDTLSSNSALAGETGSGPITDYRGEAAFAAWQPFDFGGLHWAFIAKIDESEALAPATRLTGLLVGVGSALSLLVALTAALIATRLARTFSDPIVRLAQTAETISGGDFNVEIETAREDELGALAGSFKSMVNRVRELIAGLEKRSAELATVAEVGTATATILESTRLLQEVVDLTKERFDLYHSHIYLLDPEGENLVLAAGAGEPGRIMAAEKRAIPLDREISLVARAARERKGVTVNDVTQAPDFLSNPLLPNTRSELAVPMIVGGNVIGVFDVQSDRVGRFTEADVNIQTTLAAQLATSIQNARSFEQAKTQVELETMINAIGQRIQRAATVEETLQTAARELGLALGAPRVSVGVGAEHSARESFR